MRSRFGHRPTEFTLTEWTHAAWDPETGQDAWVPPGTYEIVEWDTNERGTTVLFDFNDRETLAIDPDTVWPEPEEPLPEYEENPYILAAVVLFPIIVLIILIAFGLRGYSS